MISIGIHNPERATVQTYMHDGKLCSAVTIHCGKMEATIYGTPESCHAIADAINSDAAHAPIAAQ